MVAVTPKDSHDSASESRQQAGAVSLPTAAPHGSHESASRPSQSDAKEQNHVLPGQQPGLHDKADGAQARHEADGVWQVLVEECVSHGEELLQKLLDECREEEQDMTAGLVLADKNDFAQLASMADFDASNLPLSGLSPTISAPTVWLDEQCSSGLTLRKCMLALPWR